MAYQLGIKPDALKVDLYRDGDFDSVLTRTLDTDSTTEQNWGAKVRLVFTRDGQEWNAVVTGAHARFMVDRVETNTRVHKELVELWVGEQCWASGKVNRLGTKNVTRTEMMPASEIT